MSHSRILLNCQKGHNMSWRSTIGDNVRCSNCDNITYLSRWECKECDEKFCIECKKPYILEKKCPIEHRLKYSQLENNICNVCYQQISDKGWRDDACNFVLCTNCVDRVDLYDKKIIKNEPLPENDNKGEDHPPWGNTWKNYVIEIVQNNNENIKKYINEKIEILEKEKLNHFNYNKTQTEAVSPDGHHHHHSESLSPEKKINKNKILKNTIEIDSYFYSSLMTLVLTTSFTKFICSPLFLKEEKFWKNFKEGFLGFIFASILMFPGLIVLTIQYFCISLFHNLTNFKDHFVIKFFFSKYLIIWVFYFMVCSEISQGINSMAFFAKKFTIFFQKFKNEGTILHWIWSVCYIFSFLSPLIQITISFIISQYTMFCISSTQDMVGVVQNFAGFFILLEFDNFIMKFLKIIHFRTFVSWLIQQEWSYGIFKELLDEFDLFYYMRLTLEKDDFIMEVKFPEIKSWNYEIKVVTFVCIVIGLALNQIYFFYFIETCGKNITINLWTD